jgi:hypothetical protein
MTTSRAWNGPGRVSMERSPKPLWGEATGANATDRGKQGTKRSVLTAG